MTWNPSRGFIVATVLLGVVLIYITAIGTENVQAWTWALGGIAIGLGLADVFTVHSTNERPASSPRRP